VTRRDLLASLGIIAITAMLVAARPLWRWLSPSPTRDECAALVERRAEQLARAADPGATASTITAVRAEARGREDAISRCTTQVTRDEARCALGSHGADEFERCLGP
jgi:hypothetical protein